jgi:pantetheine-phosphate adenylyltransferase
MKPKKFRVIGLGGSFDHFHDGHRHFLEFASQRADKLLIGITDPKMIMTKPFATTIQPWPARNQAVTSFCHQQGIPARTVRLTDGFGPSIESGIVHALAVTTETTEGAKKINEMRKHFNLRELPVFVCQLLLDETGEPIHSVRIRAGEIDRHGLVYGTLFQDIRTLTPTARDFFGLPQGQIVQEPRYTATDKKMPAAIGVVGDFCLQRFIERGWPFTVGIFDGHTAREKFDLDMTSQTSKPIEISNPAGSITPQLYDLVKQSAQMPLQLIKVDGEEDLATVAAVLSWPLGSIVYYGQPGVGMVELIVTEQLKQEFAKSFKID